MINIRKSYQLAQFHLAVIICVLGIFVGLFLRFFVILEATAERLSFQNSLASINVMMNVQTILMKGNGAQCPFLDRPNLFEQVNTTDLDYSKSKQVSGTWQYDAFKHQLSYYVRSTQFFSSKLSNKIVIDLLCNNGRVFFKVSHFMWCSDMRLFGCAAW